MTLRRILLFTFLIFSEILISIDGNEDVSAKEPVDIKAVDVKICEVLKNPTGEPNEESGLMKNLQIYYEYLDNINDRIDRRWREEANVKRLLGAIGKEGPQMINVPVDAESFKKAYEWDDDDVDTVTTTILGIRHMWDQVVKRTNFLNS